MVAGMMVMVMAVALPGIHVRAAEKQTTYIKDVKIYIAENSKSIGTYDEKAEAKKAKDWFEKNDYKMVEGNVNADAGGALKKEVGVYLGYSTTTDPNEAITDLAVMNERGNYSVGEYDRIIEEQKQMYADMVTDVKDMLEEYRTNVNNGVPTAIQARDFMNGFVDPDSNKKLGDRLMTITDDELGKLLMQANGQVVMMIEDRLSYACDTGKTTWIDRMVKLGGYDKLFAKAMKSCNNDARKAKQVLDNKYKEAALTLAENWEDIRQHMTAVREKEQKWGLDNMEEDEVKAFFENNADDKEVSTFIDNYQLTSALASYSYEGKSLFDYFEQPVETFKGDGIRMLYPLVASLSPGQISGVNQTVSMFTLVVNALGASAFNDYKTGETKEIMDEMESEDKAEVDEVKESVEKVLNEWQEKEPISIYEGVDREVFDGGVAVTSTAHSFNNGDGLTWADALVNGWTGKSVAIGMAAGSVLFMSGAIICSRYIPKVREAIAQEFYEMNAQTAIDGQGDLITQWGETQINFEQQYWQYTAKEKEGIFNKAMTEGGSGMITKYNVLKGLKMGFTIACIVLAVADIVMTTAALIRYYHRDHLSIPSSMVDLSYDDKDETTFVNYKSVPDQNGGYGDINGGGGKQWLALFQTHDKDAGDPILAPENGENFGIIVQYGSANVPKTEGYTALHMFGAPNTPQNLTFADGENGWSYNDGKKGTYLFFRRGEAEA